MKGIIMAKSMGKKVQYVVLTADIFTKTLPREAFEYLRQRLGVIYTPKWMLLNVYLICLRSTRGSIIRRQFIQGEQPRMERYLCHWWQRGRDLLDAEDRGMVLGEKIYQIERTKAWFQGEHDLYNFNIASECFHQCQRGRLLIKVGCHWCQPLKKDQ